MKGRIHKANFDGSPFTSCMEFIVFAGWFFPPTKRLWKYVNCPECKAPVTELRVGMNETKLKDHVELTWIHGPIHRQEVPVDEAIKITAEYSREK